VPDVGVRVAAKTVGVFVGVEIAMIGLGVLVGIAVAGAGLGVAVGTAVAAASVGVLVGAAVAAAAVGVAVGTAVAAAAVGVAVGTAVAAACVGVSVGAPGVAVGAGGSVAAAGVGVGVAGLHCNRIESVSLPPADDVPRISSRLLPGSTLPLDVCLSGTRMFIGLLHRSDELFGLPEDTGVAPRTTVTPNPSGGAPPACPSSVPRLLVSAASMGLAGFGFFTSKVAISEGLHETRGS